jgi:hypothetical protein
MMYYLHFRLWPEFGHLPAAPRPYLQEYKKNAVIKNTRHLQYIQYTTISAVINKCVQYFSPIQSQLEEVEVEGGGGEAGGEEGVEKGQQGTRTISTK